MRRRSFIGGVLATGILGAAAPRSWEFPGTLAIVAQRLRDRTPFVTLNPGVPLPSASVIKLVILAGIVREIDARRLAWSDEFAIRAGEIVGASQTFGGAHPGVRASVHDLARAMIEQSDNTAANVLADRLSFARVNAVAADLHLPATRLRRHFMDFAARARGIDNTTSAADMARLLLGIARGARGLRTNVASEASCRAVVDFMLHQEDRVTIPAGIARHVPIANKTGVLPDVRNDVAIVDPYGGDPYVVALLAHFAPDVTGRAYARLRGVAREVDRLERSR
jgi:beta-lactamase class A